jgi:hypothetical protein
MNKDLKEALEVVLEASKEKLKPNNKSAWNRFGKEFIFYAIDHILGREIHDRKKIARGYRIVAQYLPLSCKTLKDREWYSYIAETFEKEDTIQIIANPKGGFLRGYGEKERGRKPISPDLIMLFGVLFWHLNYFFPDIHSLDLLQNLWQNVFGRKGDIIKNLRRSPYCINRLNHLKEYSLWISQYLIDRIITLTGSIKTTEEAKKFHTWDTQVEEDFKDFEEWYDKEVSNLSNNKSFDS